ncbi:dUTP diphosphatase [Clostridium cellulovorans]|uniref:dUTPase n=1 Tax=Clostridium cellulovorans (strain ATCC 35296 / DSM 3052 / OCM 3 / 743B) TaxID=573061 RepID=D9SP95_CLOC7|nr:dUTP diphosphatase [Clostridium cellulovorans]ADL53997.1 dUTPase [Clostridium cellulovorans 743B]
MQLMKLFEMQKDVDSLTLKNKSIENNSLTLKKMIGLQISIGNLASRTNCCDIWKSSTNCDKSQILEDYITALNYLLSIGLDKSYEDIEINIHPSTQKIADQFISLYIDINDLVLYTGRDHYITLLEDFFALGITIGFSLDEVLTGFNTSMTRLKTDYALAE